MKQKLRIPVMIMSGEASAYLTAKTLHQIDVKDGSCLWVYIALAVYRQWKKNSRSCVRNEPRHDKTSKMSVRLAKTQISLGICPVRSVFAVLLMGS